MLHLWGGGRRAASAGRGRGTSSFFTGWLGSSQYGSAYSAGKLRDGAALASGMASQSNLAPHCDAAWETPLRLAGWSLSGVRCQLHEAAEELGGVTMPPRMGGSGVQGPLRLSLSAAITLCAFAIASSTTSSSCLCA